MRTSSDSQPPQKSIAPYGTWKSPLTAARVAAGALRFDCIVLDGEDVYWLEGRASEGGRNVIVKRTPDGRISDVTPPGFNVRSRVHEYAGAAYVVDRGTVFFSNFDDQRLYRQDAGAVPVPLTPKGYFYADAYVDAERRRLLAVREDHSKGDQEPVNTLVSIGFDGTGEHVVVTGADFYSDPMLNPAGTKFTWLQWDHPNMPWDGTELWVADVKADGTLGARVKIAGSRDESIFQPEWSPDGRLYFVSDRTGLWNLYRLSDDRRRSHSSDARRLRQSAVVVQLVELRVCHARPGSPRPIPKRGAGRWRSSKRIRARSSRSNSGSSPSTSSARTPAPCTSSAARRPRGGRSSACRWRRSKRRCSSHPPPIGSILPGFRCPRPSPIHPAARTCTRSTTRRRTPTSRRRPASGRRSWS